MNRLGLQLAKGLATSGIVSQTVCIDQQIIAGKDTWKPYVNWIKG